MIVEEFKQLVRDIVSQACELKNKHTLEKNAPVNYAAIFSQNDKEYDIFYKLAEQIGKVVQNTPTGDLFKIKEIETNSGRLRILKIRKPEATKPERGDADFTVEDYITFKNTYLLKSGFKLIKREDHEMIELIDPEFKVRTYFSYPPVDQLLGVK
jgi:hypothetical protein